MTGRKLDLGDSGGLSSGLVTAMTLEVSVKHFVSIGLAFITKDPFKDRVKSR